MSTNSAAGASSQREEHDDRAGDLVELGPKLVRKLDARATEERHALETEQPWLAAAAALRARTVGQVTVGLQDRIKRAGYRLRTRGDFEELALAGIRGFNDAVREVRAARLGGRPFAIPEIEDLLRLRTREAVLERLRQSQDFL